MIYIYSNPEVVGSNPTKVKFSLTRGDSQISFKGVIPKGDLVYRQYCLLPAPKHISKIIIGKVLCLAGTE